MWVHNQISADGPHRQIFNTVPRRRNPQFGGIVFTRPSVNLQPMKVEFYGHVRQYKNIQKEIDAQMQAVLLSGQYVQGPMLKRFEGELAKYHGTKYAVGVGNGTDAIWLALMALGIGPGDEVITHPNTFFATAEAIWIAGATAVFVDCCPKTKCIDPERIEAAITPKTKAIIPVHLYGQCADMIAIKKIADKHKLRRHRGQRPGHRRPRPRLQDRRTQRRRDHQLHHPEEPRHLRRRRGHRDEQL